VSEKKNSNRSTGFLEEMSPEAAATLDHSSTPEGVPTLDQLTTSDQQPTELSYGRARASGNHGPPRIRMNIVLFVLTFTSSIYWGFIQYQQFYSEELRSVLTSNPFEAPSALLGGLPFGIAVIAILLAHEMGHYLTCRHYGIEASLPYFLPLPPPNLIPTLLPGTMGAVIRIRGAITSRRALFDIAVAGPIAGWVAALPILAYGLSQSRVVSTIEIETSGLYLTLGEPLLWGPMSRFFGPEIGPAQDLVMHPLAFVGWFALLITAMNLLPVGQLDGGHLLYSLVPQWHRALSFTVLILMFFAGFRFFPGWILFAVIVSVLFIMGGLGKPRPIDDGQKLGATRIVLTLIALAIFVTSFMLIPVTIPPIVFS
jgi:Zn-dependent protease|tara:strand:+ start:1123 stop:2232 length:1110 start_codon:yes stop_codon:yes gene_type:complete